MSVENFTGSGIRIAGAANDGASDVDAGAAVASGAVL